MTTIPGFSGARPSFPDTAPAGPERATGACSPSSRAAEFGDILSMVARSGVSIEPSGAGPACPNPIANALARSGERAIGGEPAQARPKMPEAMHKHASNAKAETKDGVSATRVDPDSSQDSPPPQKAGPKRLSLSPPIAARRLVELVPSGAAPEKAEHPSPPPRDALLLAADPALTLAISPNPGAEHAGLSERAETQPPAASRTPQGEVSARLAAPIDAAPAPRSVGARRADVARVDTEASELPSLEDMRVGREPADGVRVLAGVSLQAGAQGMKLSILDGRTHLPPIRAEAVSLADLGARLAGEAVSLADVAETDGQSPEKSIAGPPVGTPRASGFSASRSLDMQLEPESLGAITVRMRLTGSRLDVRLETARPETMRLIRDDAERLVGKLRSTGYAVEALSVRIIEPTIATAQAPQADQGHLVQGHADATADFSGSSQSGASSDDRRRSPQGEDSLRVAGEDADRPLRGGVYL